MGLTSSSTFAQVTAQYEDNCSYDLNDSVAECKLFIQAARFLLRRMVDEGQHGDERYRDSYLKIQAELEKAEAWWRENDPDAAGAGGSVVHADLQTLRD